MSCEPTRERVAPFPVFDITYKVFRKLLPAGAYRALQCSGLGRARSWERPQTYEWIADKYAKAIADWYRRTVIEVGCGNQIYTALHMLSWGRPRSGAG